MNSPARILILEDEALVGDDLVQRLTSLGYEVAGLAATAAEAVALAHEYRPNLVLSDIQLQGGPDGVDATAAIQQELDVPVVFVTAHGDASTLRRAQSAGPFGYVIKPFTESDLRIAIEIALQRHRSEQRVRQAERLLAATLRSIAEGVIATDAAGRITFMNPVAEQLTGYTREDSLGRDLADVFLTFDSADKRPIPSPVVEVMRTGGTVREERDKTLVGFGGRQVPIDDSCAPIHDERGQLVGGILVFRDVTERCQRETERSVLIADLKTALANVKTLRGLLPICAWCKKIRDDQGYWQGVEGYIRAHSAADFTHGICPSCESKQLEEIDKMF